MKQTLKKSMAIILATLMLLTAVPLAGFVGLELPDIGLTADADAVNITSYKTGDIIEFGWYPQHEVIDADTIAALNATDGEWISYNYYSGGGIYSTGSMTASGYMRYKDVLLDGNKYRGVVFVAYRPYCTGYTLSASNSYQVNNGYSTNTVYWFKFAPIRWRVLDPATGMVMSETILDSQPYNNYILCSGTDKYGKTAYWGDSAKTHYANNYEKSSIRAWLNNDFYNTAFSAAQQNIISSTTLDNSAYSTYSSAYDAASTSDKIYLLSYDDALNTNYGFSSRTACQAYGLAYAKCQGLYVNSDNSNWLLRSAADDSRGCCGVGYSGGVYCGYETDYTNYGVRPALNFDLSAEIFQSAVEDIGMVGGHSHDYNAVVSAPTCTAQGYTTYTCACGDSYVADYTPVLAHSYTVYVATTLKTCITDGFTTYKCSGCSATENRDFVPASHALVQVAAQAPTCTAIGWEAYEYCTECDYTTYVEIPENGHDHVAAVTAPSCTAQGYTTYTCACGDSYVADYTPVLAHSYTVFVSTTPKTCTTDGFTTYKCSGCGATENRDFVPASHELVAVAAQAPTCTAIGWEAYEYCTECDYTTYVEIPENGHSYEAVVTAPTCTAEGYTTWTCVCGDTYVMDYTPVLEHSYTVYVATTLKTCTTDGFTTYKCSGCDATENRDFVPASHELVTVAAQAPTCTAIGWAAYEYCTECDYTTYVEIPENGHDHVAAVTAPTCTEQGYTTYTCACGDTYVTDYVGSLGHSHVGTVTTPATHTATGVMTYTCPACGDTYTEEIAKLADHTYNKVVNAPTCTEQGYTTYTCACGDTYVTDYVNSLGHSHKAEVTTPATHTATGVKTYTCPVCGDTYTEVIAKTPEHSHTATVTKQPTHLQEGTRTYTCACGDTYTEAIAKTTKHTYTSEVIEEAQCKQDGKMLYVCECGHRYTETIPETGHADEDDNSKCDHCGIKVCDHICHQDGILGIFWKIIRFFWKLFGMNPVCKCGRAHY